MAVRKTISVRDQDVRMWEQAEAYAEARRIPMSGLVALALAEYLKRHAKDD